MSEKKEGTVVEKEEKSSVEITPKMQEIVTALETMTVLELAQLLKVLEEKFGVSAAAVAPVVAVGQADSGAPAPEEKTAFDVILSSFGDKKIAVIKEVRSVTGLGLKEAKELVDSCPKPLKEGVTKEDAEKIKVALEKAGAQIEIK